LTHSGRLTHTKWSHVSHGSGVDQGKTASYKPTFLPLSHAANLNIPQHIHSVLNIVFELFLLALHSVKQAYAHKCLKFTILFKIILDGENSE